MADKQKYGLHKVSFESNKPIPEFVEKKDKRVDWVKWGESNNYPQYLVNLYETSAYNNSLISAKADYIAGQGWVVDTTGLSLDRVALMEEIINQPESENTLNDILDLISLDLELFGGYSLEIIWNKAKDKIAEISYIDISKLRYSEDGEKVFYSNDWSKARQDKEKTGFEELVVFDGENKGGKQVLTVLEPRKGADIYPKPGYFGGIRSIATDAEISNFDYNTLVNGFMGGTMVVFTDGEPEEEEKRSIERRLKQKHTGTDNANGVVIVYVNGNEAKPEILQLSGNDLDKRYEQLDSRNQQKIFTAHNVVSPMLFGIKTIGQLGGRDELETGAELFQNRYVEPKQKRLERVFNDLISINGFEKRLKIKPVNLLGEPVGGTQSLVGILTDPLLSNEQKINSIVALFGLSEEEARKLVQPKVGGFNITTNLAEQPKGDKPNIENFKKFGRERKDCKIIKRYDRAISDKETADKFEAVLKFQDNIDDLDKTILNLFAKDRFITSTIISKVTNSPLDSITLKVADLFARGFLKGKEGQGVTLTDEAKNLSELENDATNIEVLYSYEVRPGISGGNVIDTTRDFCRSLINLDRLYTREEIEEISDLEGRDVWRLRGGFYHNPNTDVTTPYCRHEWFQNVVEA